MFFLRQKSWYNIQHVTAAFELLFRPQVCLKTRNKTHYLKNTPFTMKLETSEFKQVFNDELNRLWDMFDKYGYEVRIAGGAVRDLLLGKAPTDVDLATNATPEQMKEMFQKEEVRTINEKGEKHGTVTARLGNSNFEVTTLRVDVTTDGRHAEVEFTKDWEVDANRRDLTINSMFLSRDGTLHDYFNGYEDLKKRRVAFVGNPNKRIQEDYLRILRYFRFYGRISDTADSHEEETVQAVRDNVHGLEKIAGERIWVEVSKILTGNYVSSIIQTLINVGAGPYLGFPDKPNVGEFVSVWEKGKNLNCHPVTLISALMNNSNEFRKFHGRCKLSAFERELGLFIVEHRYAKHENLKPYQSLMLNGDRKLSDIKKYILELFKYESNLAFLHEFQSWEPPTFPINGKILNEHGVPLGRKLGWVIKELKSYWVEHDFKPDQKELLERLPIILKNSK